MKPLPDPKSVTPDPAELDALILTEAQLILSEKRTALSTMRTGIAILALPLSVSSVLIATSRLYEARAVAHLLAPVFVLNIGLVGLAIYLIVISVRRAHRCDRLLSELKRKHSRLAKFMD